MPFQPGQSGNPSGAKNGSKEWAAALRVAVMEALDDGRTKLRALADKTVSEGLAGNINAIKEIGDRLDGKVPQGLQNEDDKPFKVETVLRWQTADESSDAKS